MVFLRTLVFMFHMLFLTIAVAYAWLVGYVAVWRVLAGFGLEGAEWLVLAAYAAATVGLAFFLTRRRRLN